MATCEYPGGYLAFEAEGDALNRAERAEEALAEQAAVRRDLLDMAALEWWRRVGDAMLHALKLADEQTPPEDEQRVSDWMYVPMTWEAIDAVRAAIAKAEARVMVTPKHTPGLLDGRIDLPGGWYFERLNEGGVLFALRRPSGRGFGINNGGMSLYASVAREFAEAMWSRATRPAETGEAPMSVELAAGDRVRWCNPPICEGTVLKNNGGIVKVQWDTGEVRRDEPGKLILVPKPRPAEQGDA